jgi:hypothetical protein
MRKLHQSIESGDGAAGSGAVGGGSRSAAEGAGLGGGETEFGAASDGTRLEESDQVSDVSPTTRTLAD